MSSGTDEATASGSPQDVVDRGQNAFRNDIQGLRAVAVVAVISNHLWNWPSGGFVGVDVFFVISGFLITGFMLREHERTGRISWIGFYRRRVRRLLPAAAMVLLATVLAAYVLYRAPRFDAIRIDAVWAFAFLSNWHFISVGTDYWQSSGPVSPLRHFWSLAVEEQFYIAWPAIMILLLGGVRRARASQPAFLKWGIAALTLASFGWALRETARNPTVAYFSTFSRAWELGVGAVLALSASTLMRPAMMRPGLARTARTRMALRHPRVLIRSLMLWVGLGAIGASVVRLDGSSAFPAPAGALPVLGAALVIAAGIGELPALAQLLTNRVAVYIGKISYSLYLWHFPVIILCAAVGNVNRLVVVAVIAALSVASFHFVEEPVRRSQWLEGGRTGGSRSREPSRLMVVGGYTVLALSTAAVGVAVVIALGVATPDPQVVALAKTGVLSPSQGTTAATVPAPAEPQTLNLPAPERALATQIEAGLRLTDWPSSTVPSIDQAQDQDFQKNCGAPDPTACAENTKARKTAYILGDSIGYRLLLLAREAMKDDYDVHQESLSSCFAVLVDEISLVGADQQAACAAHKAAAVAAVQKAKPDVVFIVDTYAIDGRMRSLPNMSDAQQWQAGLTKLLSQIDGSAKHVIIISPPPVGPGLAACAATTRSVPADCTTSVTDEWTRVSKAEQAAASAGHASYWNTLDWYCDPHGKCPIMVGNTFTLVDKSHPTSQYLHLLVPAFSARLRSTLGA